MHHCSSFREIASLSVFLCLSGPSHTPTCHCLGLMQGLTHLNTLDLHTLKGSYCGSVICGSLLSTECRHWWWRYIHIKDDKASYKLKCCRITSRDNFCIVLCMYLPEWHRYGTGIATTHQSLLSEEGRMGPNHMKTPLLPLTSSAPAGRISVSLELWDCCSLQGYWR